MNEKKQFEDWQLRIKAEREELLERLKKLSAFCNDPNSKMNYREWQLLQDQLRAMRNYADIITCRCKYYELIEQENNDGFCY